MIFAVNGQPRPFDNKRDKQSTFNGSLIKGLYVITTEYPEKKRTHIDVCQAALKGGARIIQYRQKCRAPICSPNTPLSRAGSPNTPLKKLKKLCRQYRALFIVNDNLNLAIEVDADGLHLGQNDMDISAARKLFPNKIIGLSTHSLKEAKNAQLLNPDYISAGPVFHTNSKADSSVPIGIESLREIKKNSNVPVVAIGGINIENAAAVFKGGADAIAVISAISQAKDMVKATENLISVFTVNCQTRPINIKRDRLSTVNERTK